MAYVVLARKYRPRNFQEFIGQEAISTTLANSIASDRVAHAYLFCGPRGVGKTSMARVFAKALNCLEGPTPTPCGKCDLCSTIATGNDVDVIEIDGASNRGIEEVREIRQNAKYAPSRGRNKIYIIDEVHMLTEPAFNALLKTLEEPPPHVKFILATTAPAKLPETIHSRLQRFTFRRVDIKTLAEHMKRLCEMEGVPAADDVLALVARQARGSVRDGLSMLDQVLSFCGKDLTLDKAAACLGALSEGDLWRLVDAIADGEVAAAIAAVDEYLQRGVGVEDVVQQLTAVMRDLMVARFCEGDADVLGRTPDGAQAVAERAGRFDPEALTYMIQLLCDTGRRIRAEVDARIFLETALVKLCRHRDMAPVGTLLERLEGIEKRLASPARAPSARPRPRPGPPAESGPPPPAPPEAPPRAYPQPRPAPSPPEPEHDRVAEGQTAPNAQTPDRVWDAVLDDLKSDSWIYMQVSHAMLASLDGGRATVRFPHHLASQRSECEARNVRSRIEEAFAKAAGRAVHVHFELADEDESEDVTQDAIKHDPMIRAALDIFDGTIMRIYRPKETVAAQEEAETAEEAK